jgi:outer membrane protein OmpA-like peptidoglycan-associated protein
MKSSKIFRNLGLALALVSSVAIMSQQVRADGTTWTARSAAEANQWSSVTFGNGTFVAVSNYGTNRVMTSTDGITWTPRSVPASSWASVTYGNGVFVAVAGFGTDRIMTSPDGVTWTPRGSSTDSWAGITFGNNTFVAVASMGTNRVMTSTDGITWTNRSVPTGGIQGWSAVTWGNNKFVAISFTGFNDRVMTSPDGVTWTNAQAIHNGNWSSIAYGNNLFVATASNSGSSSDYLMTSSDGTTWTPRTAAAGNGWASVVYGGGKFVAVANSGSNRVMTSTDGITWAGHSAADASGWSSVTYGNGLYVAVASNGSGSRVMTSGALVAPTTTTTAPATTTTAPATTTTTTTPATTTTVPAQTESVPGVTVTDTKIYSRPPESVASSSAITVLSRTQNKTSDITTRTPAVCLPNDDELVFIDTGRCIADVVNTKTRQVLRSLRTTVVASDVSELNVGNEIVTLAPIYFENGSSTVTEKGRATLGKLKEKISAAGSVLVVGHSGTRNGNTPENIALSRSRALATVATLRAIKAGGPFAIAGVGAGDPVGNGQTEESQAKNRRVVVVLIP